VDLDSTPHYANLKKNAYSVVGTLAGMKPLEMHRYIWKDNIQVDQK
jgi:hypothetical protein